MGKQICEEMLLNSCEKSLVRNLLCNFFLNARNLQLIIFWQLIALGCVKCSVYYGVVFIAF